MDLSSAQLGVLGTIIGVLIGGLIGIVTTVLNNKHALEKERRDDARRLRDRKLARLDEGVNRVSQHMRVIRQYTLHFPHAPEIIAQQIQRYEESSVFQGYTANIPELSEVIPLVHRTNDIWTALQTELQRIIDSDPSGAYTDSSKAAELRRSLRSSVEEVEAALRDALLKLERPIR